MCGDGLIEGGILAPSASNVAEIALPDCLPCKASTSSEGLNRNFVQALSLSLRRPAKSGIDGIWHVTDRVLHAYILGNAGK